MNFSDKLISIVKQLDHVNLDDASRVELMNRTDVKYIFNVNKLPDILKKALKNYKILEINNERIHLYKNQYFDTSDYDMYLDHHNGRSNRYKIRYRNYDVTDVAFLEIKYKTNKDRTIKKRIKNRYSTNLNKGSSKFIETNSPYKCNELTPVLKNDFHRITLVHKSDKERITLDFNLSYTCDFNGTVKKHDLPKIAVCEIKREGYTHSSEFMRILRSEDVRQSRMSKYCIGAAMLYSDLKKNQFKNKLRYIESIQNSKH
jgi:hypothetical protein